MLTCIVTGINRIADYSHNNMSNEITNTPSSASLPHTAAVGLPDYSHNNMSNEITKTPSSASMPHAAAGGLPDYSHNNMSNEITNAHSSVSIPHSTSLTSPRIHDNEFFLQKVEKYITKSIKFKVDKTALTQRIQKALGSELPPMPQEITRCNDKSCSVPKEITGCNEKSCSVSSLTPQPLQDGSLTNTSSLKLKPNCLQDYNIGYCTAGVVTPSVIAYAGSSNKEASTTRGSKDDRNSSNVKIDTADADDEKINSHAVINDIFSGIEEERRRKREASA